MSSGRSRRSHASSRSQEIAPHAGDVGPRPRLPAELLRAARRARADGVCVPQEYGGAGADFLSYILVLEELSRADAGVGVTVAVHTSAVTLPLLAFGTDEQRARFVPPLARGERLGAFALTEPGGGSDAGALRTRAERGRRRLADHRREAVDHERPLRRHVPPLRAHRSGDAGRARRLAFILDADDVASRATRRSSASTPP